jgi:tetratricopeptide (TPR) repeat protein
MKKYLLFLLFILAAAVSFAQTKASLTKAYNFFYEKDYIKAKQAIDLCVEDEKLATKASTYLYKGNIYLNLANQENEKRRLDNDYMIQFPDAAMEAYLAFVKAKEMNKNIEGYDMFVPDEALSRLYPLLFVRGADLLIQNELDKAEDFLQKAIISYEMTTPALPLNGELYYYYAFCLEMMKRNEEAKQYFNKAIADGTTNVNVYVRLIEIYKQENNLSKVKELINKGEVIFPDNPAFYVAQVDYFYLINDTLTAQKMLENIPQKALTNADFLINISNFFIKNSNYKKAEELLRKADILTPNNFVIYYNLGVCTYYLAEEKSKEANNLEVSGNKETANEIKIEANNYLTAAQHFFEIVIAKEPNDLNALNTLKFIYARTNSPKYQEILKKIESIQE